MTTTNEREEFEVWYSEGGKYPKSIVRNGDSYSLIQTWTAWQVWQAGRAPLLSRIAELEAVAGKVRDDALEEAANVCNLEAQNQSMIHEQAKMYQSDKDARLIRALKREGK